MALVSVIIPIYNTPQDLLLRCFDSIWSLQDVDCEVLLIDDGSEPAVGEFCREYAEKYSHFRYFYRENGGVSSARNFGIRQARGQYLMFVDGDDLLLGQPVTAELLSQGHQLIVMDALVQCGGEESRHRAFPEGETVDREQLLHRLLTSKALNSPWAKLFDRRVLQEGNILFPEDFVSGEDWMFVAAFASMVERVCYVPQPCYRYYLDTGNGAARVLKHPDRIIDNQLKRFGVKKQMLDRESWSRYEKPQMLAAASVELIENLFNTAADLRSGKSLTAPRRGKLKQAAGEAGQYLMAPPKKTKLKLLALTKLPLLLGPLSRLRSAYLK